jgi:hypothetical protein
MAKVILQHNPSLTKEKLKDILAEHFRSDDYQVDFSALIGANIFIRKNAWVGATIVLRQKADSTFLRINGYAPSFAVRFLLYGLITILILMPYWNKLINEVKDFVTSEDFNNKAKKF